MVPDRLKKIIFRKLYDDLSHVEIIPYVDSIWFIDRDKKYWYFEYEPKMEFLWWRDSFFEDFFILFSLEVNEFQPILAEWVKEVLNSKVITTSDWGFIHGCRVEEVLNCGDTAPTFIKVDSNRPLTGQFDPMVENVLNYKVDTASPTLGERLSVLEGVLNNKEEIVEDIRVRIIR